MRVSVSVRTLVALLVVAMAATAGGIGYAAIPDSGGVIHGCYSGNGANAANGTQLNIINSDSASCGKNQREVTWSQTGPRGTAGTDGVSVTSTSLNVGDANCPAGGSKFTAAGANVTYACSGQPGSGGGLGSIEDLNGLGCTVDGEQGEVSVVQTGEDIALECNSVLTPPPGCVEGAGAVLAVDATSPFNFGNVQVGTMSGMASISVRNVGTSFLVVATVGVADSANFSASAANLPVALAPAATIVVSARFAPTSAGVHTSYLLITLDDGRCVAHKIRGTGT